MNKEILKIELGFENCETHTYSGDLIELIIIDDIHEIKSSYHEIAYLTKEFYLKLKAEANKVNFIDENMRDWSKSPFQRTIKYDDLVDVDIEYGDGTKIHYNLDWEDSDNWQENSYQKSLIDVDGSLHISVHARNKSEG